jgi:hypothetical protein
MFKLGMKQYGDGVMDGQIDCKSLFNDDGAKERVILT